MAKKKTKAIETIWSRDITHHMVATLAVFGLVVSAGFATLGVASIGVQAQVAFAQNESLSQTAAAFLGDNRPASAALLPNTINEGQRPPMAGDTDHHMGSSTMGMATSSRPMLFCPQITHTVGRGASEATTTGDVGQLQQFMANHFNLDPKDVVTGHFGSTTEGLLKKFQQEQGIPAANAAGPLTRAAIANLCGQGKMDDKKGSEMHPASTTNMMATGTPERTEHQKPPTPPMPPKAPAAPTSMSANSGQAASIIEAMSEIGDGYTKLFEATLSSFGL